METAVGVICPDIKMMAATVQKQPLYVEPPGHSCRKDILGAVNHLDHG
jgi:hypothetical protein